MESNFIVRSPGIANCNDTEFNNNLIDLFEVYAITNWLEEMAKSQFRSASYLDLRFHSAATFMAKNELNDDQEVYERLLVYQASQKISRQKYAICANWPIQTISCLIKLREMRWRGK